MFFKAKKDVIVKQGASESFIYDPANEVIYVLNMTAAKIFQLCDGTHSTEEIAKAVTEVFDGIDHVQAYEDAKRILDDLETKQLVFRKDKRTD